MNVLGTQCDENRRMEFKEILQLNLNTICRLSGFRLVNPFSVVRICRLVNLDLFHGHVWVHGGGLLNGLCQGLVVIDGFPVALNRHFLQKQFSGKCVEDYLS